ncbi:hypothetical protein Deia_00687 [Candidatus Deianiraea vastatrix]|uniref:Uncharacterized protein n=1 Tax=Candidatus Deianiraea vastatrix TaxID=2163644 RepID=A0A5B8XDT7_9RICK|nr:hypothetical protein Deia_00687 [Candidatus Deianiraea vastatrix]
MFKIFVDFWFFMLMKLKKSLFLDIINAQTISQSIVLII